MRDSWHDPYEDSQYWPACYKDSCIIIMFNNILTIYFKKILKDAKIVKVGIGGMASLRLLPFSAIIKLNHCHRKK